MRALHVWSSLRGAAARLLASSPEGASHAGARGHAAVKTHVSSCPHRLSVYRIGLSTLQSAQSRQTATRLSPSTNMSPALSDSGRTHNACVVSHNFARTHPAPSSSTTRVLRAWQAAARLELFRWCWAASSKLSQGANSKASCRTAWTCDDHILNMPR